MDLTRRDALKIGGFGLAGAGLVAFIGVPGSPGNLTDGLMEAGASPAPPRSELVSANGVLQGQLTITTAAAWLAGEDTTGTLTYDGLYPGTTLRAKPGDRVLLDVFNDTPYMINTHFHGMHVSPSGQADNVFAMVDPGDTFHHDFVIPADHAGGLFWYHPHVHGVVDKQIYGGLAGLIVIEGGAAALPALVDKTHHLMGLKNVRLANPGPGQSVADEGGTTGQIHTVNGELLPTYTIAPGETQLWRIANIGNDPYYRIAISGHAFTVVAEDGALLWDTYEATELLMPPGKRFEIAVTGGAAGTYALQQLGYRQGPFGDWPAVDLATVEVTGTAQTPATIPAHPAPRKDLSDQPIAAHRTVVMSESFDSATNTPYFYMNGVLFQNITPADVVQMTLGTTEEWVIRNDPSEAAGGTAEDHPFHIHVNDMVQTGRGTWDPATGEVLTFEAVNAPGTSDTLNVPPGEYVVMRMQLRDFTGRSVFHCHLTFHEDMGMMGEIQINDPVPDPASTTTSTSTPTSSTSTPAQAVTVTPTFTG